MPIVSTRFKLFAQDPLKVGPDQDHVHAYFMDQHGVEHPWRRQHESDPPNIPNVHALQ